MLSSLTVTGLQQLLDIANENITDHGLLFNPDKTVCMIYGNNPFTEQPRWHMNNTSLKLENSMKYLGTTFGDSGGKSHINNRIKAATRASFGLLSAGVEGPNVNPSVALDIYQTVVSSVLQFGCNSIYINKINMKKLDQQQSMLIKRHLGLMKNCRTSVLLKAIRDAPLSYQVNISNLDLLKKCILNTSLSQSFYCYLLTVNNSNHGHNLVDRCKRIADTYGFHLEEYIFCDNVVSSVKRNILQPYRCAHGTDGLVESIRSLLDNNNDENRNFLNLLLKTF